MNIKKVISGVVLCLGISALPLACGSEPGQTAATSVSASSTSSSGEGGFGGQGGFSSSSSGMASSGGEGGMTTSVSSSSSSSSSSGMICEPAKDCQYCVENGCMETGEMCLSDDEFWKYQNIASCISTPKIQTECVSCQDYKFTHIATRECLICAAENNYNPPCRLSCEQCGEMDVLANCEACARDGGCLFNSDGPNGCATGVVAYTDIIGCLEDNAVQGNCPDCVGIKPGDPLKTSCLGCAKAYINPTCAISCAGSLGIQP